MYFEGDRRPFLSKGPKNVLGARPKATHHTHRANAEAKGGIEIKTRKFRASQIFAYF
jgi:hypothetical protein